ncbi:tannase and feruloyl esterase [Xylariaceae sp. FL0594]|nr:tannase and feruloyl esterase [Xylariaceae sp. FL0594]
MARMDTLSWCGCATITVLALIANTNARRNNADQFTERCLSFEPKAHIPNSKPGVEVNVLEYVSAGHNVTLPDTDPSCGRTSQVTAVDVCRIALSVPTSEKSGIVYELWLPETWNGRTLATGNGGIDGCIRYEDIAYGTGNGFSRLLNDGIAFGSNNGHNGSSGTAFCQNDEVVTDFSWRALHTSVGLGKKLTAAFYDGRKLGKSYYIGCSLGGRQGIGGAEKFPKDFDGVVAGAPAIDFNSLYSWRASFFTITGDANSPGFVSAETWKTTIHEEVLKQCDTIDGVADGIIEDPTLCHFETQKLLCKTDANKTENYCLSPEKAERVETVFSDYRWLNGTLLYPRANPGGEVLAADGLYSGKAWAPSADWFKYVILSNPGWDPSTYTLADAQMAVEKDPARISTWPSWDTLAPFRKRGGKIISYHGQQDQQISSFNSVRFWERLASGADMDGDSLDRIDAFYRLFRIPGMNHCFGGPGAWVVGQGGYPASDGVPFDKGRNVLAAVVDWVEKGTGPDEIVGTKFVNDTPGAGIAYQHRHCRYPYRSTYSGHGDPLNMESWNCVNIGIA